MAKIDDIETMLKAFINSMSAFKQDVFKRFDDLDKKLTGRIDSVEQKLSKRIDGVEKRLDKIGLQLAYLDDDAPTREEFNGLEKRIHKLEAAPAAS